MTLAATMHMPSSADILVGTQGVAGRRAPGWSGTIMMRVLRRVLAPAVGKVLRSRFSRSEARIILDGAFRDYERQRACIPEERELGARLMVHFAALTVGFYRSLRARGMTDADARRLTAEVTWLVYEKMAGVPWLIARLSKGTPYERLERATRLFRSFPFRAPGYDMVDVPGGAGVVAFDVRRCPVAEYFRAQNLPQLCVDAWCNLDVPLARKWGGRLERTGTLAQGADRCDFRWRIAKGA
jgi:ubiquinone biosynthesis protein